MKRWLRRHVLMAMAVGLFAAAVPGLVQPHFKAGSVPDGICELVLLPGKIVAAPFPSRGTASPEFLAYVYTSTFLMFSGGTYFVLARRRHHSGERQCGDFGPRALRMESPRISMRWAL
jgi:hypothetical protein